MRKLPHGIQSFREIIEGDYVYADKTEYIYRLINNAKNYFLSRPRRFGKSLLLDTISEVFSGDRELFKGLWIYDSDYMFTRHPVLRFDMSNMSNERPDILQTSLLEELRKRIEEESLNVTSEIPSNSFKFLIRGLYKKYGHGVVVLIDEYDKPILDQINNIETAQANRQVLQSFYGILKSMDPYLKFTFLTGVSKFTKTSIFSGLNNLLDITLTEDYSNICGIAIEDLDKYFSDHIQYLSTLNNFKHYDNLYNEILAWYDGYSWDSKTKVINPFSLLSFFIQKRFMSFWYSSGTPGFVINLLKQKPESFLILNNLKISEMALDNFDVQKIELEPLLFQTGYLTIKDVIYTTGSPFYLLEIPNREVSDAFNLQIIAEFTEKGNTFTESSYMKIREFLKAGNLLGVLDTLKALFASIPYQLHIDMEAYYHSIFYAVMNVLGFDMDVEVSVSKGRVDAVLELDNNVYVMEFKYKDCNLKASEEDKRCLFEKALEEGMNQIKDRGYADKYTGSGKTIYQAAFAFLGRDEIEIMYNVTEPKGEVLEMRI